MNTGNVLMTQNRFAPVQQFHHHFLSVSDISFASKYAMMGESPVKNIFKVFSQEYDKEDADESFVGLDDSLPDLQPYQAESLGDMEIDNVTSEEVDNGRSNIRQVETKHKNRQAMRGDEEISTSCEVNHNLQK